VAWLDGLAPKPADSDRSDAAQQYGANQEIPECRDTDEKNRHADDGE